MIKLSLVLPAYNTAEYLEKCVESCLKQDIPLSDYEIIIINDGSTDNTREIANKLKTENVNIVVLNQNNQGLSMARNNGAEIAKGEYLWFIDSDDFIAANCLNKILEIMEMENLDLLGVAPSIRFQEQFPGSFTLSRDMTKVMSGREWISHGLHFVGAWAYVFRMRFWKENNFRFYPGICFEDSELIPRVVYKANRIASFCTFSCYSYVQRRGSIMHSPMSEKKIMDIGRIVNSYSDFILSENYNFDSIALSYFEKTKTLNYMAGLVNIAKLKDKALLDRWLQSIDDKSNFKVYGKNIIERAYQYFALKFPHAFFFIRQLV